MDGSTQSSSDPCAELCAALCNDMRKWFPKAAEVLFGPAPPEPQQQTGEGSTSAGAAGSGSGRGSGRPRRDDDEEETARVQTIDDLKANANRVLIERPQLDGGLQSLKSSKEEMQVDEDGDEAHEFLVLDEPASSSKPG